jgi:predicted DNA-binding transcriptional regulator AlpA
VDFTPRLPRILPEYLSAPQLAKLLSVSPNTIRAWSEKGTFPPCIKVSPKLYLFRTRDVRKALLRMFPELLEEGQAGEAGEEKTDNQGGGLSLESDWEPRLVH